MSDIQEGKLALVIGARTPEGRSRLVGKSVIVDQILNGFDAQFDPEQSAFVFPAVVRHNGQLMFVNCGADMDEVAIIYSEGYISDCEMLDAGYALIATKFLLPLDDDSFDFESEKQNEIIYALTNQEG